MNTISKVQFVDALTYVTSRLGGTAFIDAASRGHGQARKGQNTNRQAVLTILGKVSEAIQKKQL